MWHFVSHTRAAVAGTSIVYLLQVLSTMATQPLEDVARAGQGGPMQLFQLYVIKDRNFCKSLIQRKHSLM